MSIAVQMKVRELEERIAKLESLVERLLETEIRREQRPVISVPKQEKAHG